MAEYLDQDKAHGADTHASHSDHGEHEHHPTVKLYWVVFFLLIVALVLAVVFGLLPGLGVWGTILGFGIAIFKAVLIILYFMHVRYGTRMTWVFSSAAFVWLGLLLVMTLQDYFTRDQRTRRADQINHTPVITTDEARGVIDRP